MDERPTDAEAPKRTAVSGNKWRDEDDTHTTYRKQKVAIRVFSPLSGITTSTRERGGGRRRK